MIDHADIAAACRANDDDSARMSIEDVVAQFGVNINALDEAAMQRAYRAAGALYFNDTRAIQTHTDLLNLPMDKIQTVIAMSACFMDGFMAARRLEEK